MEKRENTHICHPVTWLPYREHAHLHVALKPYITAIKSSPTPSVLYFKGFCGTNHVQYSVVSLHSCASLRHIKHYIQCPQAPYPNPSQAPQTQPLNKHSPVQKAPKTQLQISHHSAQPLPQYQTHPLIPFSSQTQSSPRQSPTPNVCPITEQM